MKPLDNSINLARDTDSNHCNCERNKSHKHDDSAASSTDCDVLTIVSRENSDCDSRESLRDNSSYRNDLTSRGWGRIRHINDELCINKWDGIEF